MTKSNFPNPPLGAFPSGALKLFPYQTIIQMLAHTAVRRFLLLRRMCSAEQRKFSSGKSEGRYGYGKR